MSPLLSLSSLMILLGLCFAALDTDVINDAGITVQFLGPLVPRNEDKPAARQLLYLILVSLLRYHSLAAYTALGADVDEWVLSALKGGYKPLIPEPESPSPYTMKQLDDERILANMICDWASSDVKQPSAFQSGEYYPGMKMFIILHISAIACHDEPTQQRARALAVEWLAKLDRQQITLCEGFMLDVYRLFNWTTWQADPAAADAFFNKLRTKTLWGVPTGYNPDRWLQWMELNDDEPEETPNETSTGLTVFGLFEKFLTLIFSYIRELMGTGYRTNNASQLIEWIQCMWVRVEGLLANDDPIKENVQTQLNEIRA